MQSIKTILVIGLGSIGKRHLVNLSTIYPNAVYVVLRHQLPSNPDIPLNVNSLGIAGVHIVYDLDTALAYQPEIAIVCSPATEHIGVALVLAHRGIHLFIEKPISNTLAGVDDLIDVCKQKNLVLMIGYVLRFLPSLRQFEKIIKQGHVGKIYSAQATVGQYLPDWRPNTDYRNSVSARNELGGGVLLELSHEIDYLMWLFGGIKAVQGHARQLSDLEINVEDSADVILHFSNGIMGNVHMDMLQRQTVRMCRVVGSLGTLVWDGIKQTVTLLNQNVEPILLFSPPLPHQRNNIYLEHIQHFLDCVLNKAKPFEDAQEAKQVLEVVVAIKEASRTGITVKL